MRCIHHPICIANGTIQSRYSGPIVPGEQCRDAFSQRVLDIGIVWILADNGLPTKVQLRQEIACVWQQSSIESHSIAARMGGKRFAPEVDEEIRVAEEILADDQG